ncbi:molybdopterin molybdotransferase MoeA [Azospirillum thermophilum]|uniref:molybdopterin molybdotransferase MoeA n=1 Tax=Azospirillum thermophilum TaxID=2202148 RepID=UPI0026BF8602
MDCCAAHGPAALPLDEAVARLATLYGPVTGTEEVPLRLANGRVLAEDVAAPVNVPPVAVSAMDGWAYRAAAPAEGRRPLRVVGRVPAGSSFAGTVGEGEAVRIFTGAPIPAGADTVAMQEDCAAEGDSVLVPAALKQGANVRPAGEDMRAGAIVLKAGHRLRPQEVGLAAAVGRAHLTVRKRLRVGLFSTGDELREPGTAKPAHAIYDANRFTLAAQLTALGWTCATSASCPTRPTCCATR